MTTPPALNAFCLNLAEPFSTFKREQGQVLKKAKVKVTKEMLQSALCESLDRTNMVSIYNEIVLSPDENRIASELSRYLDKYAYGFLSANVPSGQNGLIDVHTVKMTSAYGVVLIQRLDND